MGSATAIVDSTTDLQGSRGSCGRYCDDTAWKTEAARNSALAVTEIVSIRRVAPGIPDPAW